MQIKSYILRGIRKYGMNIIKVLGALIVMVGIIYSIMLMVVALYNSPSHFSNIHRVEYIDMQGTAQSIIVTNFGRSIYIHESCPYIDTSFVDNYKHNNGIYIKTKDIEIRLSHYIDTVISKHWCEHN